MNKNLTEVVFILDRSGSMGGLEADTIGGYNSMLKKQQEEEGDVLISTVLFDDVSEVIHDRKHLKEVKPLTDKEYFVRGCTALLDALGGSIKHIKDLHKEEGDEAPEKTVFIITTDGLENASSTYTYDKVKKMVEKRKKKDNWEFIFMGANIDAIDVAKRFGVNKNRAVRFESDGMGHALNYETMNKFIHCCRLASTATEMTDLIDADDSLKEIRDDYEELEKVRKDKSEAPDFAKVDMDALNNVMGSLPEREKEVVSFVFGTDDGECHTYVEAGAKYGMSKDRAHQVVARTLKKIST